eukprot:2064772-Amphidinium_carterae.1
MRWRLWINQHVSDDYSWLKQDEIQTSTKLLGEDPMVAKLWHRGRNSGQRLYAALTKRGQTATCEALSAMGCTDL